MSQSIELSLNDAGQHFAADFLAYISIQGPDAVKFLQGQLTVDVAKMQSGEIRYTAQCDAKGKMSGLGFLQRNGDDFVFIQDRATIASSLAQFQKFGVFSQVTFSMSEESVRCVAYYKASPGAASSFVTEELPNLPNLKLAWFDDDNALPETESEHLLNALFIRSGVALLKNDMDEEWVPQMMNVQALNGIDFDKGCYMGQEVVARTKYLGKNKRALYCFVIADESATTPEIGTAAYRKLGENWRKAGTVVNAATTSQGVWIAVVLPNDVSDNDTIAFDEDHTLIGHPVSLPYVIESETSSVKLRKRNE